MKYLLAVPMAATLMGASAPNVSVIAATGDWSKLPQIRQYGYDHLTKNLMSKLIDIALKKQCTLPGFDGARLNFDITFAAAFAADGTLQQVVIPKLNCPEAESLVGGALVEMINGHDYKPAYKGQAGWYQGEFTFAYEE